MSTTQLESQDTLKEQAGRKMFEALGKIMADLPSRRDWLDPVTEGMAIEALAAGREAGWGQ